MKKRSLIVYYTYTGNTEKVAKRFKKTFEKNGWECDLLRVDRKTDIMQSPSPFDCSKYDFIGIGSGVYKSIPHLDLIDFLRNNPQDAHYDATVEKGPIFRDQIPDMLKLSKRNKNAPPPIRHRKIVLGPENKKGMVFVTYSGHEFGPVEAIPALELLASELMHLQLHCAGKFSCPGRFLKSDDTVYNKDLMERPNERDLMKAEIFLEEILETLE